MQAYLNNIRSQSGNGMQDVRNTNQRSADQNQTQSGNPMQAYNYPKYNQDQGPVNMGYQNQYLGRYAPPTMDQYGKWGDRGGYAYNLPNSYGPYQGAPLSGNEGNYPRFPNYSDTQAAYQRTLQQLQQYQPQGPATGQGMAPMFQNQYSNMNSGPQQGSAQGWNQFNPQQLQSLPMQTNQPLGYVPRQSQNSPISQMRDQAANPSQMNQNYGIPGYQMQQQPQVVRGEQFANTWQDQIPPTQVGPIDQRRRVAVGDQMVWV